MAGHSKHAVGPPRAGLIKMRGMREHVLAGHGQFGARRHGVDLRAARHFELIHRVERLLDGRAAGQKPVVAHHQRVVRPEIGHDPLALVGVDRRAFIVVVADMADKADRGLRQRKKPAFHRRHRHAGAGVRMQNAGDVRAAPCGWRRGSRSRRR